MRKTIFLCVGNILLFALFGLAFLFPFSEFTHICSVHLYPYFPELTQIEYGLQLHLTIFPFLLLAYLIAYPVIYYILANRCGWRKGADSELSYADEREKVIVAASTKAAYQVLIGGLLFLIATIGGVRFFSLFTGMELSIYATTVALLTALLIVASVFYCVTWCREYQR